jgi:dTDP-4-amino-4,6-dideoxygalactose transaminase
MNDYLPFTRPSLDEETIQGVVEVLRSGWITSGPMVERFEAALAGYFGGERHVRTFSSATGALEQALALCSIGHGDEVIVPAMTFAAGANVVVRAGAKPVLVDVDLSSRNIDFDQVEAAVTPRTRVILPVHFAGLPVDMERLYAIAARHGLRVIEDAAHAIGSAWHGRKIGAFGDMVVFSFHANKNLTTIEGGAISVADEAKACALERARFHGIVKHADGTLDVVEAGGKYNLTDVAARVGLGQLPGLDARNAQRRALAERYFERLGDTNLGLLPARGDCGHSWHMFTLLPNYARFGGTRGDLRARLHAQGIGIGIHYQALHTLSFYQQFGYRLGQFPNAERIGRETITLPLFPAMRLADVDRVCDALELLVEGNS